MQSGFTYRQVYRRAKTWVPEPADVHPEVEATGVPPGGVRWKLETRYRPGLSGYRDVLLQSILAMCRRHKLTPLDIRHPPAVNGQHFVDVIFADGYEVNMAYDNDLTFEFYGTYPQPVSRGIPDFRHVAMCIQFLAASCDLKDVMAALHRNFRIRQAGRVIGAWAIDRAETGTFSGRLLVLLELHTHHGLVSVGARTAVPGWFVYQERSYLLRSANRLAWCANPSCRMSKQGNFHSMHTCPHTRCITCGTEQHTSVVALGDKRRSRPKRALALARTTVTQRTCSQAATLKHQPRADEEDEVVDEDADEDEEEGADAEALGAAVTNT